MRRISLFTLFAVLLFAAILPLQTSFTVRAVSEGERLAMYSKPGVVKIFAGAQGAFVFHPPNGTARQFTVSNYGWGSGFFINPNGYIMTNAHVTADYHAGEDKLKEGLWEGLFAQVARANNIDPRNLTQEQKVFIYRNSNLTGFQAIHHVIIPDGSVYTFEIKAFGAPVGEGENWKDISLVKIEVKNAPCLLFGDSDKVQLQDHIAVIGYPGAAETTDYANILNNKSSLESSITDGKISARKTSEGGAPVLQISAPTFHGNSGGPVLNDNMEVIGLLTFRGNTANNGQEVQGFNFVVAGNTAKEFLSGVTNELGPADKAYRDGLELYWGQQFSSAIKKFEEVKRLFPQHSEVDRLIQNSQQGITDGKDKSGFAIGGWLIGGVVLVLLLLVLVIVIAVVVFLLVRRKKSQPALPSAGPSPRAVSASPPAAVAKPEPAKPVSAPFSPAPFSPPAPSPPPPPPPAPRIVPQVPPDMPSDRTMDLSATIAIRPAVDTAPISYGKIKFVSGALTGQQFDVNPEGACIGRDASSSQIVIADPRISKRHLWIGVRDGRVTIVDDASRNGTFLNDPKSPRVTESNLSPGDTVILGESDVARFEYQS